MKKTLWIALGILALACTVAFVGQSQQASSSQTEIGVLMPFSQNFAWWGAAVKTSAEIAQKNGYMKNTRFFYSDTKCDTKDAVTGIQALKALHPDMHLFFVGCDNDLKAMYPFMDKTTDLAFMVGLSDQSLYGNFPTINLAYRLESEATAAADFAYKALGVRNLGIIVDNQNFGSTLASTSAAYFAAHGGSSERQTLGYNDGDPTTALLTLLQAHPDAIYMQNDIPGMSTILKRLAQLGYKGDRIMYYGGHDQSLIDTAGAAAEGAYVPWVMSSSTNALRTGFEQEFKSAYGQEPFISAYFIYDGLTLLDQARKSCGADSRCIESYFYDDTSFTGTLGHVRYEPNGFVDRAFTFQQVKNGKFVDVQ